MVEIVMNKRADLDIGMCLGYNHRIMEVYIERNGLVLWQKQRKIL